MQAGDHGALNNLVERCQNDGTLFNRLMIEKKNFGSSALHLAVFRNCIGSAKSLLDGLEDTNEKLEILSLKSDKQQITALHQAAENKACLDLLSLFIESIYIAASRYELLKTLCGTGRTVLHCAIQHKNMQAVHMILNAIPKDKRLEYITGTHGQQETSSTLHYAASFSDTETVDVLLDYLEFHETNAALVSKDMTQRNILHLAVEHNSQCEAMVTFVLDRLDREHCQMILWETDHNGLIPLHTAAMKGLLTCVDLLLTNSNLTKDEQLSVLTHKHEKKTVANKIHSCFTRSKTSRKHNMAQLRDFLNKTSFHLQSIEPSNEIIKRVQQETKYEMRMATMRDMLKGEACSYNQDRFCLPTPCIWA